MNKKFSTLIAGLLLAGAFVVNGNAQVLEPTGDVTYRKATVMATALDQDSVKNVYNIDGTYWYQLLVLPTDGNATSTTADSLVLIQVRDPETGVLKLQVAPLPKAGTVGVAGKNAVLNQSLWRIVGGETGTRGMEYTFQNKETGAYLSYNMNTTIGKLTDLTKLASGSVISSYTTTTTNSYDQAKWLWYSDVNNGTVAFGPEKIYAYTHKDRSFVVGLAVKSDITGSLSTPVDVVPVQVPASAASMMSNVNFLAFKVVNAGVKVLNANEINGMINADEELADNDSVLFKATPAISNALFSGNYKAEDFTANARGYNIKLKAGDDKYFAVAQDATYESSKNPTEHGGLVVGNEKVTFGSAIDAVTARAIWKVSYYATPDSIVLEPYNASIKGTVDAQNAKKWADTGLALATSAHFYNTINAGVAHTDGQAPTADAANNVPFNKKELVPVALTVMNIVNSSYDKADVLTVGQSVNAAIGNQTVSAKYVDAEGKPVVAAITKANSAIQFANMGIKIQFMNTYSYLTPATVASGLYFINLFDPMAQTDARTNGAYIVDNMAGWMMYDKPAKDQNFNIMPATMWVVDQDSCFDAAAPTVKIANREYGYYDPKTELVGAAHNVFEGQLYQGTTADGKTFLRSIDQTYPSFDYVDKYGKFVQGINGTQYQYLHSDEAYTFTKVTDAVAKTATHGYKAYSVDELTNGIENNYYLKYNNFDNDNLYLYAPSASKLAVTTDQDSTIFEIGEATFLKVGPGSTGGVITNKFGYSGVTGSKAGVKQLTRNAYYLKVKDTNLLDNNKLYVAYAKNPTGGDKMWYYTTMVYDSIISGEDSGIAKRAPFYMKADQMHAMKDTSYVLVDVYELGQAPDKHLTNGWSKANVVDGLGNLRYSDLDENPADRASAFYTNGTKVNQYVDLSGDYSIPASGLIKIYRENGTAKEYLFEDKMDQSGVNATTGQAVKKGLGYLAIEGKGISYNAYKGHAALYVDPVYNGIGTAMPTYLLCVAPDSVPDGYVCETQTHGYWTSKAAAEAADESHYVPYNGYVAARYLVNLQDSVDNNIYMLEKANMFKWQDYTRLAFLEGIHQVDTTGGKAAFGKAVENLYLVKDGHSLADFYTVKNNSFNGGYVPGFVLNQYTGSKLASLTDSVKTAFWTTPLVGKVNTKVTWSFRKTAGNTGYGAAASEPFLMENSDATNTAPGLFTGAWVKVQNGVPVIAQIKNMNGNHEGTNEYNLLNEVVNQAQIFHFETTTETPTSAVAVSVSNVNVLAGEGNVQILNAAGKRVVISNILGQTVANTVVSSDNASIAAPAGVVVVAIEGAKAVKAIVK